MRLGGLSWHPPGASGVIGVDVDIRGEPASEDSSWLSISTRFGATDEDARVRLFDAWSLLGPLASTLADCAARTVRDYAEDDSIEQDDGFAAQIRAA